MMKTPTRHRGGLLLFLLTGSLGVAACRGERTDAAGAGASTGIAYRCDGFAAPLEGPSMEIQRGRTLPLKARLLDPEGKPASETVDPAPEVRLLKVDAGVEADRSELAAAGDFGKAQRFVFRESYWKFDLATADFSELGTYRVELVSGDESRYRVDPRCSLRFTLK